MSPSPFILVAPSTRGISLALTRHFLRTTTLPVFATHRSGDPAEVKSHILSSVSQQPNENTNHAERLHMLRMDLTDEESIKGAAKALSSQIASLAGAGGSEDAKGKEAPYLHTGFFTGGVLNVEKRPADFELEKMRESFMINTLSHMLIMREFERFLPNAGTKVLPLSYYAPKTSSSSSTHTESPSEEIETKNSNKQTKKEASGLAKWVHITARVGSISDNRSGGWYTYRSSKAALAQLVRTFDHHLRMRSIPAIALGVHPGTVKTKLSREFVEGAEKRGEVLEPEESARRLVDVICGADEKMRGCVWDHRGEKVPS